MTDVRRQLYLSAVLSLFRKGFNTRDIAKILSDGKTIEDEAGIERALHQALDEERRSKADSGRNVP